MIPDIHAPVILTVAGETDILIARMRGLMAGQTSCILQEEGEGFFSGKGVVFPVALTAILDLRVGAFENIAGLFVVKIIGIQIDEFSIFSHMF